MNVTALNVFLTIIYPTIYKILITLFLQWLEDDCDQLLVDALCRHEMRALLERDIDFFINLDVSHLISPVLEASVMIVPSLGSGDFDPPHADSSLVYSHDLHDWTHVLDSSDALDTTVLPEIPDCDDDEVDVEDFIADLNGAIDTSTQWLACQYCTQRYVPNEMHECDPCPCCGELVCICGYPPEECFLCKKIIGVSCTCPFD